MSEILLKKLPAQYTKNVCGEYWFKEFPRRRSVEVGSDVLETLSLSFQKHHGLNPFNMFNLHLP